MANHESLTTVPVDAFIFGRLNPLRCKEWSQLARGQSTTGKQCTCGYSLCFIPYKTFFSGLIRSLGKLKGTEFIMMTLA